MNSRHVVMLATVFANALVQAQVTPTFDVEAYRRFLSAHQNLSTTQLLELHPAGVFQKAIGYDPTAAIYFSNIDSLCQLTTDERALLQKHGFVVSERLSRKSFGDAFVEIFHRDLPVFVSTDAILHAMHMSYDVMLKKIELSTLIPDLDSLLSGLHKQLPVLVSTYENIPEMRQSLSDVDVYLSVARALLGATVAPTFPENWTTISGLLSLVQSLQPADYALFSTQRRTIDFSQFKVRGHYTQHPELEKYFQAMMWLGRTELYLISPEVDGLPTQADNNIQRQTIDAMLVLEALEGVQDSTRFNRIDQVIQLFVGESDNVTIANLRALRQLTGIQRASDLTDTLRFGEFRETLRQQAYAFQRILSQIFISDPYNPDQIHPAAAFLLFGQRFVIDSYISANVVYDRIIYNNEKIKRMLPMPLDVLFPLGNNAAAQLLEPEVDLYHYGSNLASLRYLVDAYDEQFWKGTLYNGWLQSIRALSPPTNRNSLPAFMQTAAWWQEKMNTQLASWAQLRHDNLLYAKQSYSGGIVCSFPESYVEPIPQFYAAVKTYAEEGVSKLTELGIHQPVEYFRFLGGVADTLHSIAIKTLNGTSPTAEERTFLKSMLRPPDPMCGAPYEGWYTRLFYGVEADMFTRDLVVADIHTAPTDEFGNPIGWVMHVGTGPVNLALVTATLADGNLYTFVGPVMSYYEYLSTGFQRLSDEEWATQYRLPPSARPSFVNLYLADTTGDVRAAGLNLVTDVALSPSNTSPPSSVLLEQNYPNPFNPATVITYHVSAGGRVVLKVFDVLGREIATLVNEEQRAGTYVVNFDLPYRQVFPSGVYFYRITAAGTSLVKKMMVVK